MQCPSYDRSSGVHVDAVTKVFGGDGGGEPVVAVDDLSFRAGSGETVGLIGPNGAGKSTILKLIAGVTAPTSGRIVRVGHTVAVIELGAGMSFDLTGDENIELLTGLAGSLGRRGSARRRQRDDIVAFAGLGDVVDQPIRQYSTGMVARLALSVALHCDPEILLVDEVLSVGDLAFQEQSLDQLSALRRRGCTIVLVSHDLEMVQRLCDRVLLVVGGSLETEGDAERVVNRYLGRKGVQHDHGALRVSLRKVRLDAGDDLVVDVTTSERSGASMRIEFLAPNPMVVEGEDPEVIFGSTTIAGLSPSSMEVHLSTRGLPPGRYDILVTVEDVVDAVVASATRSFVLDGPVGPNAIRLWGEVTLDGAALGGFG